MNDPLALARPEIRALRAYDPEAGAGALERLHANELPWPPWAGDEASGLHRYPEPQPRELLALVAGLHGVEPGQALLCRGSDEAIDLVVRGFCAAGRDTVVTCPPTFGMYALAARIQGAAVHEVPLRRAQGFALDLEATCAAARGGAKVVFLCTPNNPTGNAHPDADLAAVLEAAAGRAMVVVDEAYMEFTGRTGCAGWIGQHPHLLVLRTLSKAYGLAGARIGALLGARPVVDLLRKVIPPYALARPAVEAAVRALQPAGLATVRERVQRLAAERERLAAALGALPCVRHVWPGCANFLLVEVRDADAAVQALARAGLRVRAFRDDPWLGHALRITVGTPGQGDRVLEALRT
ncbi:MAG: histidinol-phosphate transaminase [Planctomycetia bacterium]